jgi:SHS2 domain-containing protein
MSFTELDHTADVLIRVQGKTIEELFSESARAMFSVMYEGDCTGGIVRTFALESDEGLESLLLDFLSELLFITDAESLVCCSFGVTIKGNTLSAIIEGEEFDPGKHSGGTIIKGISYSGLQIVKEDGEYVLEILFDV